MDWRCLARPASEGEALHAILGHGDRLHGPRRALADKGLASAGRLPASTCRSPLSTANLRAGSENLETKIQADFATWARSHSAGYVRMLPNRSPNES